MEWSTLAWNVVGVVLALAAIDARSVALAGFGLDSLIEIGASTVVLWELCGTGAARERRAIRMIGLAFVALAIYLTVQCAVVLATGFRPQHSTLGITWTAVTAVVMFGLAAGKPDRVGRGRATQGQDRSQVGDEAGGQDQLAEINPVQASAPSNRHGVALRCWSGDLGEPSCVLGRARPPLACYGCEWCARRPWWSSPSLLLGLTCTVTSSSRGTSWSRR